MPTAVQVTQSPDTNNAGAASVATQAFGAAPTQHNAITGHVSWQGLGTTDLTSVTDNRSGGSNTYAIVDAIQVDSAAGIYMASYLCQDLGANATALTVTANFSTSASFRRISAQEYSGVANTAQPHKHAIAASATFGTGADAVSSGAQTTTIDGCEIWGVAYDDSTATIPAVGTNFFSRDSGTFTAGDAIRVESRTQATQGSAAALFTTSAGTDHIGVVMMALAPAAAPTPPAYVEPSPTRNRPGRGPYSLGAYFRPDISAFTTPPQAAQLAAVLAANTGISAGLSSGIPLNAALASRTSIAPALSSGISLVALLADNTSISAQLSSGIPLVAALGGVVSITGSLGTPAVLAAILSGRTSITAAMSSGIALQASSGAFVSFSAALSSGIPLGAALGSIVSISAQFGAIPAALSAVLGARNSIVASMTTGLSLSANLSGLATITPSLTSGIQLAALPQSIVSIGASLTTAAGGGALAAVLSSKVSIAAGLATQIPLSAVLAARTGLTATLSSAFLVGGPRYIVKRDRARPFTVARMRGRTFTVSAVSERLEVLGPQEKYPLTFDFSLDLDPGETLVGPPTVLSIVTSLGVDINPSAIQNGAAALDATQTKVILPAKGGLDGCEYDITIECPTSNPLKVLTLIGTLPVRVKNT